MRKHKDKQRSARFGGDFFGPERGEVEYLAGKGLGYVMRGKGYDLKNRTLTVGVPTRPAVKTLASDQPMDKALFNG